MDSDEPSSPSLNAEPQASAEAPRRWGAGRAVAAKAGAAAAAGLLAFAYLNAVHAFPSPMERMQKDPTCAKVAQQVEEVYQRMLGVGVGGMSRVEEGSYYVAKAEYICGDPAHPRVESVEQDRDLRGVSYEGGALLDVASRSESPPPIDLFNWRLAAKGKSSDPAPAPAAAPKR